MVWHVQLHIATLLCNKLVREDCMTKLQVLPGASKPRGNDASCVMDILGGGRKNSVTFYTEL